MHENSDNRLSYQGDDADGYSVYEMKLEGRALFEARVSATEAGLPIYVRQVASPLGWHKTTHRAFLVDDQSRVSAMSMKEAIYMNLPLILADLLVGPVQK